MITFIVRRLILAVVVLLISTFLIFSMMRMIPGDPVLLYYSQSSYATFAPEELEQKRHELGLDQSIPKQYIDWVANVFSGDLGDSIFRQSPVTEEIMNALPITQYIGLDVGISACHSHSGWYYLRGQARYLDRHYHNRYRQFRYYHPGILAGHIIDIFIRPEA